MRCCRLTGVRKPKISQFNQIKIGFILRGNGARSVRHHPTCSAVGGAKDICDLVSSRRHADFPSGQACLRRHHLVYREVGDLSKPSARSGYGGLKIISAAHTIKKMGTDATLWRTRPCRLEEELTTRFERIPRSGIREFHEPAHAGLEKFAKAFISHVLPLSQYTQSIHLQRRINSNCRPFE